MLIYLLCFFFVAVKAKAWPRLMVSTAILMIITLA